MRNYALINLTELRFPIKQISDTFIYIYIDRSVEVRINRLDFNPKEHFTAQKGYVLTYMPRSRTEDAARTAVVGCRVYFCVCVYRMSVIGVAIYRSPSAPIMFHFHFRFMLTGRAPGTNPKYQPFCARARNKWPEIFIAAPRD